MTRHLKWKNEPLIRHVSDDVPDRPGVYAILSTQRRLGVPVQVEPLYVGKTVDLRRRLIEHADPWREHNKTLIAASLSHPLEFWFAELGIEEIDEVEKHLIREIKPPANRIHYKNWKTP